MTINALEIFPWNNNFATGIDLIDQQHKRLIELLNLLVSHLAFQSDVPTLNSIFDELKNYTAFHFSEEEEIWKQNFPDDEWLILHQNAHCDFIAEVIRLKGEEHIKPLDNVIEDIVSFLTQWLASHILEVDKRMFMVVLALAEGKPLMQAKNDANQEMAGAARILIDTVMTMYDKLANSTIQMTREINKRIQVETQLVEAREKAEAANHAKSAFFFHRAAVVGM